MTIVDTSVWSIAYRRREGLRTDAEARALVQLRTLAALGEASLIGPIRQELLTGIRSVQQYDRTRAQIAAFELIPLRAGAFDRAATFSNQCRSVGIAAGDIDMMICAIADQHSLPILTLDLDFPRYATVLPIALA